MSLSNQLNEFIQGDDNGLRNNPPEQNPATGGNVCFNGKIVPSTHLEDVSQQWFDIQAY